MYDRNEVFDDGILKYRAARADKFSLEDEPSRRARLKNALIKNLSTESFLLETALTCRTVSNYLGEKFLEEASLGAVYESLDGMKLPDVRLLLSELPNLLSLPYPAVKDLREASIQIISQTQNFIRKKEFWKDYSDLEHLQRLLRVFKE